ncbi:hypothetical protein [Polycyclovorans algicola]|uniref:hypothetical protein n=1 Tax=Polycyclovorans algicola TaxID=616992 RepID=UPI00126946A7|nr:hypothetical protein [Polycyclovorans algicola]
MINSQADFEDATVFELYVLEKLHPAIEKHQGASLDLRGGSTIAGTRISISATASMSGAAESRLKDQVAPLLFGSAWKLLDLLLEFALNKAGLTPNRRDWTIAEKQQHALNGAGDCTLLGCVPAVWDAMCRVYGATVEHRHCLIHRTAAVDDVTGSLQGVDRNGQQLRALSRDEQVAFAKVASLAARGVIVGGIDQRSEDHLKYQLDQLVNHSGCATFGVGGSSAPVEIELELLEEDGSHYLDLTDVMTKARRTFPTVAHFDLVIDVPGESGRKLVANAENCPAGKTKIDLSSLPAWLEYR